MRERQREKERGREGEGERERGERTYREQIKHICVGVGHAQRINTQRVHY